MGKLKPTFIDQIIGKRDKYNDIIDLRNQIEFMTQSFYDIYIVDKVTKYETVNNKIGKFLFLSLDEEKMIKNLGKNAVINRLTNDRDELFNLLKNVKEVSTTDFYINISQKIREKKLNNILNG